MAHTELKPTVLETVKFDIPSEVRLPFNQQSQSAIIGHILGNPQIFTQTARRLQSSWFLDVYHSKIYEFILKAQKRADNNLPPNELELQNAFMAEDIKEQIKLKGVIDKCRSDASQIRWEHLRPDLTEWMQAKILQETIRKSATLWNSSKWKETSTLMSSAVSQYREASFEEGAAVSFDKPERWAEQTIISRQDALTTGSTLLDKALLEGATAGGLIRGDTTIVLSPVNCGKCEAKGTELIDFSGKIIKIEDVKVGDQLMGPDGTPRNVLSTTKGYGPMFKITPNAGGVPFVCNDVHVLSLKCTMDREPQPRKQPRSNKPASNGERRLWNGDIVNIPLNEYQTKSKEWKYRMKLWRAQLEFDTKDLSIDPYVFGLWLGDGHSDTASLTTMDKELADIWCSWVKSNNDDISVYEKYDENGNLSKAKIYAAICSNGNTRINSNKLLIALNNKNNKHIPHEYLTSNREQRLQLLAGLIDTDGYSSGDTKNPSLEITQKNKELANNIGFLARSLGFKVSQQTEIKQDQNGTKGEYVRSIILGKLSTIPTRLSRKRANDGVKNASTTGFKVSYVGMGDYYGFTLDGDHLYLHSDFTVTHNTSFMITVAINNIKQGKDVLFMTHEGRPEDIRNKIMKSYLNMTEDQMLNAHSTPESSQASQNASNMIKQHLVYIPYNKAGMKVEDVVAVIRRVQEERIALTGKGFDLLVVDYPAKLSTEQAKSALAVRNVMDIVYEYYVQLALEYQFHALLAIQSNREGSKVNRGIESNRLLMMEDVAEAWGPMASATNVITLNRSVNAKRKNRLTYYVAKSRSSETGAAIVCESNYAHGLTHHKSLKSCGYYGTSTMETMIDGYLTTFNGQMLPQELVR